MNIPLRNPSAPRSQRGASAVEFAFVFPILFLLIYATVVYSYIYVLQQSITYTAQYLAEAAIAVDPNPSSTHDARIQARVQALANNQLSWLPTSPRARVLGTNGERVVPAFSTIDGASVVTITLTFDLANRQDFFPTLSFPGIGALPPLPPQLQARATARI